MLDRMAKGSAEIKTFFRAAFTKPEWDYLRNHESFSELLGKHEIPVDELERLTRVGNNILLKREESNRKCS